MKRTVVIPITTLLLLSVSCSQTEYPMKTTTRLASPETTTSPFPPSIQVQEPGYNSVTSTLEAKGEYMFSIYLKSDQTLRLT
jgi:hypothetical protein